MLKNFRSIDDPDSTERDVRPRPTQPSRPPNPSSSGQCGRPAVRPQITQRIFGGYVAKSHSWPWQVSIQLHEEHDCGGSLIGSRHVLTAAHCFENNDPNGYKIVIGLHDRTNPESSARFVGVQRITKHPNYNSDTYSYDFAILRLASQVTFNDNIKPICLAETDVPDGKDCVVTGWGTTRSDIRNPAARLMQVNVPTVARGTCSTQLDVRIDDSMFCAGGKSGKDSCQGDSGGPLVCQRRDKTWELQGVVSYGSNACGVANRPGVYGRVVAVKNWINRNLN